MEKGFLTPILVFVCLIVDNVLPKSSIDVSERLSENICGVAKDFKSSLTIQPELKSPMSKVKVPKQEGTCWVWRWTKCEFNAKVPCSTWKKIECPGPHPSSNNEKKKFCERFQCGWTLDELHMNWGYNPEHVEPIPKELLPKDETEPSGATLDFPNMSGDDNEL